MKPISLQDIFNAAWQRFVVEQAQPGHNGRYCAYRGKNDSRCAIGAAIPDELYDPEMEGCQFGGIVGKFPDLFDGQIRGMDSMELDNFQTELHDYLFYTGDGHRQYPSPDQVEQAYRRVAATYNLEVPA